MSDGDEVPEPTLADLMGAPHQIDLEFRGVKYEPRDLTIDEMCVYQRWLEAEARQIAGSDPDASPEERAADRHAMHVEINKGTFEFYGEVATARRRTYSGQCKLWEVMFGLPPEDARAFHKENAERVVELFRRVTLDGDPDAGKDLMGPLLRLLGFPRDFLSAGWSGTSSTGTDPAAGPPSGDSPTPSSPGSGAGTAGTGPPANSSPPAA